MKHTALSAYGAATITLAVALTGCASPTYLNSKYPDKDNTDLQADHSNCLAQAQQISPGNSLISALIYTRAIDRCMEGKGWKEEKAKGWF